MGRVSKFSKADLVDYDKKTDLARCLLCDKTLKGNLLGNIKRHYTTIHKFNFNNDVPEPLKMGAKIAVEATKRSNYGYLNTRVNHDTPSNSSGNTPMRSIHDVTVNSTSDLSSMKSQQIRKSQDLPNFNVDRDRNIEENKEFQNPVIYTPITASRKESRDHSDIFGEHVAAKHRKYSNHVKNVVEHLISQILFEADMGKHDQQRNVRTISTVVYGNPFSETDAHQENLLQNLKVPRSSSTSSESRNLETHHVR